MQSSRNKGTESCRRKGTQLEQQLHTKSTSLSSSIAVIWCHPAPSKDTGAVSSCSKQTQRSFPSLGGLRRTWTFKKILNKNPHEINYKHHQKVLFLRSPKSTLLHPVPSGPCGLLMSSLFLTPRNNILPLSRTPASF